MFLAVSAMMPSDQSFEQPLYKCVTCRTDHDSLCVVCAGMHHQQEERRESQRVRYLTSQHSPMQKDQLQHDSHMWLD